MPGPRGELWRDTAIRGHRQRGTGFLNNELYIGRLVWNRLRYVKDPMTGRRVSRINASSDWVTTEVPELRSVDDALWEAVKTRQGEIDADPRVKAIKATKFWEEKRPVHLLTGLLVCGCCGGSFAKVGREYMACSAARKLNTCTQTKSVRRAPLEEAVFTMLRDRLMQPDAVAEFVTAYTREVNNARGEELAERSKIEAERKAVARKLEGLYDAIAEGLRTPGLKERLEGLEGRLKELDVALEAPAPSPVRFHPGLAEAYRKRVGELGEALRDPELRVEALEIIRGLITRVTVTAKEDGVVLSLEGALSALIGLGQSGLGMKGQAVVSLQAVGVKTKSRPVGGSSIEVVAGARIGHCFMASTPTRKTIRKNRNLKCNHLLAPGFRRTRTS